MTIKPTRCGIVAVIGPTNAGKSTLVNKFIGSKVSIVTHKVQTTRSRIRAISILDLTQIIYVDTPGIFAPQRRLERAMVDAAWVGAEEADIVLLVIDSIRGIGANIKSIIDKLSKRECQIYIVLNKIDNLKRELLLRLIDELKYETKINEIFMVSALNGEGVSELQTTIATRMPAGPWLFPDDQLSDLPQRLLASEITREKVYLYLHQELPYSVAVDNDNWKELKDNSIRIEQVIYVQRESQKGIVLGSGGKTIKRIRMESQRELSDLFETKVHLFLHVKVSANWINEPGRYREWGLRFDA
ncbi:MAG: GTPase Era [Rhodospirillaceae bacterium]|nr:GTPase Era [Rhodospirillaceae bacterium]|tara:strand:+ start:1437 stop:2339 length:903 start_codon:yes stop_codon:yes gene_type:complete